MKRGLLIYDSEGAKRNFWFIEQIIASCKERGLDVKLVTLPEACFEAADFAIVRAIAPEVNAKLESEGVRVFNNALTSKTANDKWLTYLLCKRLGLRVTAAAKFFGLRERRSFQAIPSTTLRKNRVPNSAKICACTLSAAK